MWVKFVNQNEFAVGYEDRVKIHKIESQQVFIIHNFELSTKDQVFYI